jgi:tripartite-type tricarboxylate transporter receptor subunit TctC
MRTANIARLTKVIRTQWRQSSLTIKFFFVLACVALLLTTSTKTHAQAFPNRPITLVMPYGAGANMDVVVRAIVAEAAQKLGQPIVVENKSGALSRLGVEQMRRAPPDGYLLTMATDGLAVTQPVADPEFKFEVGRDFAPVTFLASFPLVLVSSAAVPFRDVNGLIAYGKAHPGKLNVAGGPGSISQIAYERLNRLTGGNLNFIPYKDTTQAMPDLMAGRVDMLFSGSQSKPAIDSGKLRALATTGSARWKLFPELPTLQEAGINMTTFFWIGIVAPPATPKDVVAKLNQAFVAALQTEAVAKRMTEFGMSAGATTPEQFADFIKNELNVWGPVIRAANIKVR